MLGLFRKRSESDEKISAINNSQAVIEFTPDGKVISANDNFLKALGYTNQEISGRHHSMFVAEAERESPAYQAFWTKLRAGEAQVARFRRIAKDGREVWIEASYNPLRDGSGRVYKVVKYAVDVTGQVTAQALSDSKLAAVNRSQAVITFALDGTIEDANENFLKAVGYHLDEIKGRHHRIFVEPAFAQSRDYDQLWQKLRNGEVVGGQFKRIGKNGREIWLEASYNPIFDANGKVAKVMKFATDVTNQVRLLSDLKALIDVNFSELDQSIEQTELKNANAADAAARTNGSVQMVASATEELAASIQEISNSMSHSREAADEAVQQTDKAGQYTRDLVGASSAMEGIVSIIRSIAGQINLLALNATIESARAGEAGKGFAVVANEVKNLANQASRATEQISQEIQGLQSVSQSVAGSLATIHKSITAVQEYVSSTASAVEEQSAVTRSMSANMQETATSVTTIAENIGDISASITQAGQAVSKTKEAAQVLAR